MDLVVDLGLISGERRNTRTTMARRLILRFGLPLGVSAGLAYNISRLDKLPASHVASCANLQPESSTPSTVTAKTTVRLYSAAQSFPDFRKHTNVLAEYLSSDLYALLRDRQTPAGVTLDQCIQVGVDQPGHPRIKTLGIFAGDEESYQVFREIFDLVIMERHGGYTPTDKHPTNLDSSLVRFHFFAGTLLRSLGIICSPDFISW